MSLYPSRRPWGADSGGVRLWGTGGHAHKHASAYSNCSACGYSNPTAYQHACGSADAY